VDAAVGLLSAAVLGLLVGIMRPSLALFSTRADSPVLGTITAGYMSVTVASGLTWQLTTPPIAGTQYEGETVSGSATDADDVTGLWLAGAAQLTLGYTGTVTLDGDNLVARMAVTPITAGTSLAAAAATPGVVTYTLSVLDAQKAPADASNLMRGTYTFTLNVVIADSGLAMVPGFGTDPDDWALTLGYPQVVLEQVRA
jgi:hypothetical protein